MDTTLKLGCYWGCVCNGVKYETPVYALTVEELVMKLAHAETRILELEHTVKFWEDKEAAARAAANQTKTL